MGACVPSLLRSRLDAIVLATAMLACPATWAGRPLVTEDAGTLARADCEWESYAGRQQHPAVTFGSTQLGCGIGWNSQLAIGTSRYVSDETGSTNLALSGKTAFGEAKDGEARLALAYTLYGRHEGSVSIEHMTAEVKGVITVPVQDWLLHANAGLLRVQQEREKQMTWALAAERLNAFGNLDLMGEVTGVGQDGPWVQAAARWNAVPGRLCIDASAGLQANRGHASLFTLGIKYAF